MSSAVEPRGHDGGSAAVTTIGVAATVAVLVLSLVVVLGGLVRTWPAAAHAADTAALAVLAGSALAGGDGEPDLDAGQRVAGANGGALTAVDLAGWPSTVVVTVMVPVRLPWGPGTVRARAAAALIPQ